MNRTLGEPEKTMEVFEMLLTKYPETAKSSLHYAKDELFAAKRYDILRKFIGNPMREYSMLAGKYGIDTTLTKRLPAGSDQFIAVSENNFVEKSPQRNDNVFFYKHVTLQGHNIYEASGSNKLSCSFAPPAPKPTFSISTVRYVS